MNAALLEQTASRLTRHTRHWERRLRLGTTLVWAPRAVIAGLLVGVALGLISWARPWWLPERVALVTAVFTGVSLAGTLAAIWLWRRSTTDRARYFDQRFDLKERVSTALELSGGLLPLPNSLAEHQLHDAIMAASAVRVRAALPLRVRRREWLLLAVLGAAFAYLMLADNPRSAELAAERALEEAIAQQAAGLEQTIEQIQADDALTPEEQAALTEALQQAVTDLNQPDISQEEAVAALAGAGQALGEMQDGMLGEQEAAYQSAARELAGSDLTSDMAQALQELDLNQAADAADDLAEQMQEEDLSPQERDALAERLDSAAEQLEDTNPALAEKMREAAQALRDGNLDAAQRAMQEAADLMRRQQAQLDSAPLAQAAQSAGEQVEQGARELAQVGQEAAENQTGQPDTSGEQQQGQLAESAQQEPQGAQDESMQQAAQQGETSGSQSGASQEQQGETQASAGQPQAQGGPQSEEQQSGQAAGETSGPVDASASQGESQSDGGQSQQAQAAQSGPSAGSAEGGAGVDTTEGQESAGSGGEQPGSTAAGGFEANTPENAPSTIGGQSQTTVDLGGQQEGAQGVPVQEGDFGPNPAGEANLTFRQLIGRYQNVVSNALDNGRIPLDQRDVIHDYFSSLER